MKYVMPVRADESGEYSIDPTVPIGLYIVQSTDDTSIFRAGAAGIREGQKGTLQSRLRGHRGYMPHRPDVDWTEFHKPWKIVWTVQLREATCMAGRLAEQLLFGTLASRFVFIKESGESGFHADPMDGHNIRRIVENIEQQFDKIVENQLRARTNPIWIKHDAGLYEARLKRPGVAKARQPR